LAYHKFETSIQLIFTMSNYRLEICTKMISELGTYCELFTENKFRSRKSFKIF